MILARHVKGPRPPERGGQGPSESLCGALPLLLHTAGRCLPRQPPSKAQSVREALDRLLVLLLEDLVVPLADVVALLACGPGDPKPGPLRVLAHGDPELPDRPGRPVRGLPDAHSSPHRGTCAPVLSRFLRALWARSLARELSPAPS